MASNSISTQALDPDNPFIPLALLPTALAHDLQAVCYVYVACLSTVDSIMLLLINKGIEPDRYIFFYAVGHYRSVTAY